MEVGDPWTKDALARLASFANPATLAVLDLCATTDQNPVTVATVANYAASGEASVRDQLAGLTMQLKNPKSPLTQRTWPFVVTWTSGGCANYSAPDDIIAWWREIRVADVDRQPADLTSNVR